MKTRASFAIAVASLVVGATAAALVLVPMARAGAAGTPITYVPIDSHVFVSRATAAGWAKTHNEAATTRHAVALWNALTRLTNQRIAGNSLAVFSTWYTPCDVYPVKTRCNHAIVHDPFDVEIPNQFFRNPRISSTNIFSGVKYNQEMADFITTGYGGSSYADGSGLVKAIAAGEKDLVDTAAPQATMTKPVYQLISSTQPTTIGYWQGPGLTVPLGASTSPLVPDVSTWLKIAVVDPTGKVRNDKAVTFCANTIDVTGAIVSHHTFVAQPRSYKVVPLSEFYWFPMSVADSAHVAQLRADFQASQAKRLLTDYGPRALKQDPGCPATTPVNPALALVGMHVVTAEFIDTWTWQTFWWQPSAAPIPGARGPFRHFDYATAYWTLDSKPFGYRVAFNPYLEADQGTGSYNTPYWPPQGKPGSLINLGRDSNCISCHQVATYTIDASPSPNPGYVSHDDQPQIRTKRSILVRNLWSLGDRASHPGP